MEKIYLVMVSKINKGNCQELYINKCFNNIYKAKAFGKKYSRIGYKVEII